MHLKKANLGWVKLAVSEWQQDPDFAMMFQTVTNIAVVNDCAERFIKLVSENIMSVRSEEHLTNRIVTVAELHQLASDLKRNSYTKKQLELTIHKVLKLDA